MRGGLVALLDAQPDMSVGAALECADKAVPAALEMDADVALIAAGLAGGKGFAVANSCTTNYALAGSSSWPAVADQATYAGRSPPG